VSYFGDRIVGARTAAQAAAAAVTPLSDSRELFDARTFGAPDEHVPVVGTTPRGL
jgi:hypothetical protein